MLAPASLGIIEHDNLQQREENTKTERFGRGERRGQERTREGKNTQREVFPRKRTRKEKERLREKTLKTEEARPCKERKKERKNHRKKVNDGGRY